MLVRLSSVRIPTLLSPVALAPESLAVASGVIFGLGDSDVPSPSGSDEKTGMSRGFNA